MWWELTFVFGWASNWFYRRNNTQIALGVSPGALKGGSQGTAPAATVAAMIMDPVGCSEPA